MRLALVIGAAVLTAGCGSTEPTAVEKARAEMAKVESTCTEGVNCAKDRPFRKCTHVSRGFRACTTFLERQNEKSAIYRRVAGSWVKAAGSPRGRPGWWRRVVAASNRRTVLAQWSGECEIQTTYLVSVADGAARPILEGLPSTAVGWASDGRARVRLPADFWGMKAKRIFKAGIYRVDPVTLAVTLERAIPTGPAC
jgi:hypothetical protein